MFKKAFVFLKCLVLINVLFTGFSLNASADTGPKHIVERSINYQCSLKLTEQFILNSPATVTINATVPEWVDPYEHFYINVNSIIIKLPKDLSFSLKNMLLWNNAYGNVDNFTIVADNFNYSIDIGNSLFFEQTPIDPNDELSMIINPQTIVGPLPAGEQGMNKLSIGNITFKLKGDGADITLFLNCALTDNDSIFASILIN